MTFEALSMATVVSLALDLERRPLLAGSHHVEGTTDRAGLWIRAEAVRFGLAVLGEEHEKKSVGNSASTCPNERGLVSTGVDVTTRLSGGCIRPLIPGLPKFFEPRPLAPLPRFHRVFSLPSNHLREGPWRFAVRPCFYIPVR